ncbi:MAG: hypothetical protein E7613_05190 [Ruminococcaceae bacterium]|nr:hypothetical protein [Oscillospiraceae bacterium]
MKRFTALILALILVLSQFVCAANFTFSVEKELADGLIYTETAYYYDDGLPNRYYMFEYTPGLSSLPIVSWGEYQKSRKTLGSMASSYDGDVVGGINADFFSLTTGIPLGCLVSNGRFLSSSVENNALAIMPDGTLHIGKPDIASSFTYLDKTYSFYYNKYPQKYSLYIVDSTYGKSTASTFPCLEIVLTPESDVLTVNSTTVCTVAEVFPDTMDTPIPEGGFVLSIPSNLSACADFLNITPGETIEISVTGTAPWDTALNIIGGGDIIVKDGAFVPEVADDYSDNSRNARTAVGIREDGSGIFFAVNGKKTDYSSGLSFKQMSELMISMDAVTVLNLDGGGSTTVGVKNQDGKFEIVNYPTDGSSRKVSNAILFLNSAVPDGKVAVASFYPDLLFALPGARIDAVTKYYDSSMTVVDNFAPFNAEYFSLLEGAFFDVSTLVVTEGEGFERQIAASYTLEDGTIITDDKTFYVPDTLDEFKILADTQILPVGGTANISVLCEYKGYSVASSLDSFKWSFDNQIETLQEGVLAENDIARLNSDGTITVLTEKNFTSTVLTASYKDKEASVTIYVGMDDVLLDDYESTADETPEVGYKSSFAALVDAGVLSYKSPLQVPFTPTSLKLMYKGKYSSDASVVLIDSTGAEYTVSYSVLTDYSEVSGWTELEAPLPQEAAYPIRIKSAYVSSNGKNAVIDNLRASYGYEKDLFDDVNTSWAKSYITALYNMGLVEGYVEDERVVFAPDRAITRAEFAKLVSSFCNYSLDSEELFTFNDSEEIPEWAKGYINAVAANNVMNGRAEGDGSLTFAPNAPITRTEAMLVLSRIMPEIQDTSELLFTDSSDVPDWALDGVKKTVSAGIITGYDDNTIKPSNNITRAETAVVFSRLFDYMYEKQ